MKKKLAAVCALLACVFAFAACSSRVTVSLGRNWQTNTSGGYDSSFYEQLTYDVRYERDGEALNNLYYANVSGTYTVTTQADSYYRAADDLTVNQAYRIDSVLTVSASIVDQNGDVVYAFGGDSGVPADTIRSTVWFRDTSEEALRGALVERHPRESYQLATKCAAWIDCKTRDDAIAQFETSLERTGAGYFDFYLLHNLGEHRTEKFNEFGLWDWILEQKAAGKIKHAGFSFHSTPEELDELLTAHPEMEFVQLQINYADWENPSVQSRGCYEVARAHNKPVVIMEPVKGGMLANPPESVARVLKEAEPESSAASWAIRFAASLPGPSVAGVGCVRAIPRCRVPRRSARAHRGS